MIGVFWGYVFFFGFFLGGLVGCVASRISAKMDDNTELPKYVPSIEEILCVLRTIRATYRCSPHEDECMEEAIRLIESMSEENEDDGE